MLMKKTFVIKGTPHQIQYAQHIIRIKLGDISPGTPLSSGSATGGQFSDRNVYGSSSQFGLIQQATQDAGVQSAAVSLGQQQTLYQLNQHGVQAAQQDGGAAPSIDPLTGQPDYSAQWANYYRAMGMVEQAEQVELQIRQKQQQLQLRMGMDIQGNSSTA